MRRNRGQGSIIRRTGTQNLFIRYYDRHGRQVQEATGSPVQEVAERLLQRRLGELGLGIRPAQDVKALRYEDLRDSYVEEHANAKFASAKSSINHLDGFFAKMPVLDIDTDEIRRFIKRKREQGLSDPTIRRILVDLRSMFNQAKREGKIRHADVPFFPMPADSKPKTGFLAAGDFEKLLSYIPKHLQPVLKFSYLTGCRIGATKKITWDMVNRDCTEIELPGEITKTGQPLALPLVGPLAELSTTLKKMFRDDSKPVFDVRDLRYSWYSACAKAGFGIYDKKTRKYRGLQIHDFRRSAVRNLVRAGVPRGVAMSISGHKTESVFERYNITDATDRKDALIRVGQYLARQKKEQKAASA